MKRTLFSTGALLVGALLLLPMHAQAQDPVYADDDEFLTWAGDPSCDAWDQTAAGYVQCAGNFSGNDNGAELGNVISWIDKWWLMQVALAGSTDPDDDAGVFEGNQFDEGSSTGTLFFDSGISGLFVLTLKSARYFSLYQFDTGGDTWYTLDYSTEGVAVNGSLKAQDLSHSLYLQGSTTVVPEPASAMLLLSGLMGLGAVAWRRRDQLEE